MMMGDAILQTEDGKAILKPTPSILSKYSKH